MRIGVVSDSHHCTGRLQTILMVMESEGPIDALIHLGDGYWDLSDLQVPLPPVYQVAGNCDVFRSDTLQIVTLSRARLLLTHGHLQRVKRGLDQLADLAAEEQVSAALYGHTHVQRMDWERGVLLLNPGLAGMGYYAVLQISPSGELTPELRQL